MAQLHNRVKMQVCFIEDTTITEAMARNFMESLPVHYAKVSVYVQQHFAQVHAGLQWVGDELTIEKLETDEQNNVTATVAIKNSKPGLCCATYHNLAPQTFGLMGVLHNPGNGMELKSIIFAYVSKTS